MNFFLRNRKTLTSEAAAWTILRFAFTPPEQNPERVSPRVQESASPRRLTTLCGRGDPACVDPYAERSLLDLAAEGASTPEVPPETTSADPASQMGQRQRAAATVEMFS